jgi:hypothetical protein
MIYVILSPTGAVFLVFMSACLSSYNENGRFSVPVLGPVSLTSNPCWNQSLTSVCVLDQGLCLNWLVEMF